MNFIILHGSGAGPDMWQPWLKLELEKLGHSVWMPTLPTPEEPDLSEQLPFILNSGKIDTNTIFIGHSSACPLILSVLENIDFSINKSILVAGYFRQPISNEPIWQKKYKFSKIKQNCHNFVFVVSDNDPWGCNNNLSQPYFDKLGGTMVIVKDGGHFGSNTFKQPLYEFPLLLKLTV